MFVIGCMKRPRAAPGSRCSPTACDTYWRLPSAICRTALTSSTLSCCPGGVFLGTKDTSLLSSTNRWRYASGGQDLGMIRRRGLHFHACVQLCVEEYIRPYSPCRFPGFPPTYFEESYELAMPAGGGRSLEPQLLRMSPSIARTSLTMSPGPFLARRALSPYAPWEALRWSGPTIAFLVVGTHGPRGLRVFFRCLAFCAILVLRTRGRRIGPQRCHLARSVKTPYATLCLPACLAAFLLLLPVFLFIVLVRLVFCFFSWLCGSAFFVCCPGG